MAHVAVVVVRQVGTLLGVEVGVRQLVVVFLFQARHGHWRQVLVTAAGAAAGVSATAAVGVVVVVVAVVVVVVQESFLARHLGLVRVVMLFKVPHLQMAHNLDTRERKNKK